MDERNMPRRRNIPNPRGSRDPYVDPSYDQYTEAYYEDGYADYDGYGRPAGGQMYGPPPQGGRMYGPPPGPVPDYDDYDDDDDQPRKGRRKMLLALGGGAIVMAGGGAFAASQLLADKPKKAAANTQPDGYGSENESYMGSEAGLGVMKNTPANGVMYGSPAEAAANTIVTASTVLSKDPIRHLASRLTFGPTPKVIGEIKSMGINAWINKQLNPSSIPLTKGEQKLEAEMTGYKLAPADLRARRTELDAADIRADQDNVRYALGKMIFSDRQLFEMMVDFWNDHLHVAAFGDNQDYYRAAFDRDVIRKHALGSYTDMFLAANRHPSLLQYLDQDQSSKNNINENLARENLELYTVGVNGGYTEIDVRQAAILQTGRRIDNYAYVYDAGRHATGAVKIMGFRHANTTPQGGEAVQDQYFRYLAGHPSTARYIATQMATRFVSDVPPKSLIDRMAKAYLDNKTKIAPVLMVMLRSSEFWGAVGQKVRRPMEYVVSTYRTLGVMPDASAGFTTDNKRGAFYQGLSAIRDRLEAMGQFPMGQATPNGYPDVFPAWTSAGGMINGWNEAVGAVEGARREFSYVPASQLVAKPPATAGAYLDALSMRLVHQTFSAKERDAILKVAGPNVTNGTRVDANFNGAIVAVVRTILASPQHHLR